MVEAKIRTVISDLWTERFPQNHTTPYPKGLIKTISQIPFREKDGVLKQYQKRISVLWYDDNTSTFDDKSDEILTALKSLESDGEIVHVQWEGTDVSGYDPIEDKHVLDVEVLIEYFHGFSE